MKRIKLESLEQQRQREYQKQKNEIELLLSNGASESLNDSNTYRSKDSYHYQKELQRLEEIRHSYYISANKSKLEEVDKQIELHKKNYINKNRKDILIKIKDNIILLFNSFKSKDR